MRNIFLLWVRLAAVLSLTVWFHPAGYAQEKKTGAEIYKAQCASCHGANGEGTKSYQQKLEGNRSVKQLASYISEAMPEDDPEACTAADAEVVAAYIHDAFYSPIAQERNKPARIALPRLTVRQYRNTLADLVSGFRWYGRWNEQRGLKGVYYKSRGFNRREIAFERVDPQVNFQWGKNTPDPSKMTDPHQFSMIWTGSVLAEETGLYDFVIHTEHAMKFWINDYGNPTIDAWVKSGTDTEYRTSIFLIGGRVYPLQIHFSKAKQGVNDSQKNKNRPVPDASFQLAWKPPHGVDEPIPTRCLSPVEVGVTYVVNSPFPPDDRSLGWERGTTVSKEWDSATTQAALETADYILENINHLATTDNNDRQRTDKIVKFCQEFVRRAFRRDLTDAEKKTYVDRHFVTAKDLPSAIKTVVLYALKSPKFLYRELGQGNQYDVAARLSYGLWDSMPTPEMLYQASAKQFSTPEQIRQQAQRMLEDPRAKRKLHEFFEHWLLMEHAKDMAKDEKVFPDFDAKTIADLRTSIGLSIDEMIWNDTSDFRQLMRNDRLMLNGRLAKIYGADLPDDAPFQMVKPNGPVRSGVITHPFLLANFAYSKESSPIHRGVFLTRGMLGLMMRPPPVAVSPVAPDLHPSLSTRERVAMQTAPQTCMSCHGIINPLGFALEHFDAIGRYREADQQKPVNSTGYYLSRSGEKKTFQGAQDLANFLAESSEVHEAFTQQMFHHVAQQPIRAYGPNTLAELTNTFQKERYNIKTLVIETVTRAALGPTPSAPLQKE